jgi:hypothetical protein
MVTTYSFVTRWEVDAPIERVVDALSAVEDWPSWWRGVRSVERIAEGDASGVGAIRRFTFRSLLPYSLVFSVLVTEVSAPHRLAGQATGELEGTGVWTLSAQDGRTQVRYDWNVRTTRCWMNLLGPIARPIFARNHDIVMNWGRVGLAKRLGVAVRRA